MTPPVLVPTITCDSYDKDLANSRAELLSMTTLPNPGEFVAFPDGSLARVAYVFGPDQWSVQYQGIMTGHGGSFLLAEGYCLRTSGRSTGYVKMADLELTKEMRPGDAWLWHHDRTNGCMITRVVNFRVWRVKT